MTSAEELRQIVAGVIAEDVKPDIVALREAVQAQNGRVGKLEKRMDAADERWRAHGHFTAEERQAVLDGINNLNAIVANAVKAELRPAIRSELALQRNEADAERYRQLRNFFVGILFGAPTVTLVGSYLLERVG